MEEADDEELDPVGGVDARDGDALLFREDCCGVFITNLKAFSFIW